MCKNKNGCINHKIDIMRYLVLTCFTLLIAVLSFRSPEQFEVKGIVVSVSNGSPIAGVSVVLKGTNTITNTELTVDF